MRSTDTCRKLRVGYVELRFEEELIKPGLFGMHPYVGASILYRRRDVSPFLSYLRKC